MSLLMRNHAEAFAVIGLGHVTRQYPNNPAHRLNGPDDLATPRSLHPIFYGSFDWHSCVHTYWLLARLLRRFPDLASAARIRDLFDAALNPKNVAGECAYFALPDTRGFERPYGWAWLLKLAAELRGLEPRWGGALAPLAGVMAERFRAFLPVATYPVRAGTHGNTAFALRLAADGAAALGDGDLRAAVVDAARRWYMGDADCQAWEPGGDDFLSPALVEAECLRRLLPPAEFEPWFAGFLPRLGAGEPATLFRPAVASDRTDGKLAHLDGLNLSRVWCWRALAPTLPPGHPAGPHIVAAVEAHLAASLPSLAVHYMGEHWLASFALLALDGA